MLCYCALKDGQHWYVDTVNAPNLYYIASSPEEAERYLRSWAGRVVRTGRVHIDMRPTAAKVLAAKVLNLRAICAHKDLIYPFE